MNRSFLSGLALFLSAACASPAATQTPPGLQLRVDESTSASDPDDVPTVKILPAANGFEVQTGPAAVVWNPANTASGNYTLKGTFKLNQRSSHTNYYGLVLGGRDLATPNQNYLYFLVGQDGSYLIKHRMGDMVHDIVDNTRHASVVAMAANAPASSNALEVRVGATNVDFVINGTVVNSTPRSGLAGATDGIWGVRVNHVIPSVTVEGLGVTR